MKKKKYSGLLAVVMIAAVAALNVSLNSQKETLSDLAMENVEALADESGGSEKECYKKITTRDLQKVFYCGECDFVYGKPSSWSGKGKCTPK